jgi:hypothetical protein
MSPYNYRITVEKLTDAKGAPVDGQSLSFYAANHDDILAIVGRVRERLPLNAAAAASLGVGLKLFSEVALLHRNEPLFAEIRPALGSFIKQLKRPALENA